MKQTTLEDFEPFSKFIERLTAIERKRQNLKIEEETGEKCPYCYMKGGTRLLCSKRMFRCGNKGCNKVFYTD
jgi:hypothetical protein